MSDEHHLAALARGIWPNAEVRRFADRLVVSVPPSADSRYPYRATVFFIDHGDRALTAATSALQVLLGDGAPDPPPATLPRLSGTPPKAPSPPRSTAWAKRLAEKWMEQADSAPDQSSDAVMMLRVNACELRELASKNH